MLSGRPIRSCFCQGFKVFLPLVVVLAILLLNFSAGSALVSEPAPGSPSSWSGWLVILWGDGPQQVAGSGESVGPLYWLADGEGRSTRLVLVESSGISAGDMLDLNGQRVVVEGVRSEVRGRHPVLAVRSIRADAETGATPRIQRDVTGPQPWISILCKFYDVTAEPKPLLFFQDMYGSDYPGLSHYWSEQSYGLANVMGSGAVGWYTLPHPRSTYVYDMDGDGHDELDFDHVTTDCTALADAAVYFPDYVGINLMFNDVLDGYAWGGARYLALDGVSRVWRMTWEPPWGYQKLAVIAHEMGHGFGLPHSSGNYGEVYDNYWDVMSMAGSACSVIDPTYGCLGQHTIAVYKDRLGWIAADRQVELRAGSQETLVLERLALPQTNNLLLVTIPIADPPGAYYTVEARRWAGYDVQLSGEGVIIHQVRQGTAYVVDVDGDGNTGDDGAMWRPGETWEADGVSLTVDSETTSGFIVTIQVKGSKAYLPFLKSGD